MKKLLLLIATSSAILSSTSSFAQDSSFYLKLEVGGDKLQNIKTYNGKMKQNNAAFLGGGIGYYILDNVRTDLIFDYYVNQKPKSLSLTNTQSGGVALKNLYLKVNPKISTLMINSYIDVFDISICKVFVGAGIGVSQLKSNIDKQYTDSNNLKFANAYSTRKKNDLAYQFTVGATTKVASGTNLDISYSWKNLGSTRKIENVIDSVKYKGHHVTIGLRFDI